MVKLLKIYTMRTQLYTLNHQIMVGGGGNKIKIVFIYAV